MGRRSGDRAAAALDRRLGRRRLGRRRLGRRRLDRRLDRRWLGRGLGWRVVAAVALVSVGAGALPAMLPGAPLPGTVAAGAATTTGGDGGGSISVGATGGSTGSGPGAPGSGGTTGSAGGGAGTRGGAGATPWTCQDFPLEGNDEVDPPGGPLPGGWFAVICNDPADSLSTETTEWISTATRKAASAAPVAPNPYTVALQAERSLALPSPALHSDPSGPAVVNLATYLWITGVPWTPETVSASVAGVTATATAVPTLVTWTMGNGDTTTCDGPGAQAPPPAELPAESTGGSGPAPSTGDCSYTYAISSAGQSATSASGAPAFVVTATVRWSVSWTSTGVVGGGSLPGLTTTGSTTLPVAQIESVETVS